MILDHPLILQNIFFPRRLARRIPDLPGITRLEIEVEPGVMLGGRLYAGPQPTSPLVLFFHGNGEIAADYDGVAGEYTSMGVHLLVMDYRGYGRSTGKPTLTNLLADASQVYRGLPALLKGENISPEGVFVMGRSLGSLAAVEIAAAGHPVAGLILESGIADPLDLAGRVGIPFPIPAQVFKPVNNQEKIRRVSVPLLVLHGTADRLLPPHHGQELYQAAGSEEKELVWIEGAGHNDIMSPRFPQYFDAIRRFIQNHA